MLAVAGAVFLGVAAPVLALRLGLVERVRAVLDVARAAAAAVADPGLDDDAKGAATRAASGRLILGFLMVMGLLAVSAAVPLALLWGLDRLGVASLDQVLAMLVSPVFLAAGTALALAAWLVAGRLRRR